MVAILISYPRSCGQGRDGVGSAVSTRLNLPEIGHTVTNGDG